MRNVWRKGKGREEWGKAEGEKGQEGMGKGKRKEAVGRNEECMEEMKRKGGMRKGWGWEGAMRIEERGKVGRDIIGKEWWRHKVVPNLALYPHKYCLTDPIIAYFLQASLLLRQACCCIVFCIPLEYMTLIKGTVSWYFRALFYLLNSPYGSWLTSWSSFDFGRE